MGLEMVFPSRIKCSMLSIFSLFLIAATFNCVNALLPHPLASLKTFGINGNIVSKIGNHEKSRIWNSARKLAREDSNLEVDPSTLSPSEQERLKFIQKLSLEADEMIRAAGIALDSDDRDEDEVQRSIRDTKWSGQSDMDELKPSTNSYEDLSRRTGLAIGDVGALLTFAAVGRSNHGEGMNLFELILTAAPFVMSWIAISPFLGAYSRDATSSKSKVVQGIIPAWLVSVPFALAVRGVIKGAIPPTPFIIVSLVATLIFLSTWRYAYISIVGSTSDNEYKDAGLFEIFKMVGTLMRRW